MDKKAELQGKNEFLNVCQILKNNGVDLSKIPIRISLPDKTRKFILLKDVSAEGIDIHAILEENGLSENYKFGDQLKKFKDNYNSDKSTLSSEERSLGESLGIVKIKNTKATPPLIKGGKLSQFHLDYINGMIDKIINGQINNNEALALLKQACIDNGETIINDVSSIKRCVEIILKDRPQELETYHQTLKKNMGSRGFLKNDTKNQYEGSLYYEKEQAFKQRIINDYLPLILDGTMSITKVAEELSTTNRSINAIIEEYHMQTEDLETAKKYEEAKRRNGGLTDEVRENAKLKREEVSQYKVVTIKEFTFLSPEEQERQIIMKTRLSQLKKEQSDENKDKSALTSAEFVQKNLNNTLEYFRSKNPLDSEEIYFSDQDIRNMIFRFPTLMHYSNESKDEKIDVLTSFDEIDLKTAYGMIKTFPTILGYSPERTRNQLELTEKSNIVNALISEPRTFMLSVNLMHSLIEFAKERTHTDDLSKISPKSIFMANSICERVYGVSHKELLERFPYKEDNEETLDYEISPNEIGKSTYKSRDKAAEARKVLSQAIQKSERIED